MDNTRGTRTLQRTDSTLIAGSGPERRLEQRLRCAGMDRLGLVPFLMAGHLDPASTLEMAQRLGDLGVAALELGIPSPDPHMDGPVIAEAARQALARGATVASSLELASRIVAATDVPVVLMTYAGPLLAYGPRRFALDAAAAGVAGVIVPDLAKAHRDSVATCLDTAGVDPVGVVAFASSAAEVAQACRTSRGFVYCALAARTGVRATPTPPTPAILRRARCHTSLPLVAGFGISRPEHLVGLHRHADAAVVGSAVVARMAAGEDVVSFVKTLLTACR
ncbi:MAG: tryptophan synthase subunit alpha [Acidimicrobiales bacterium]